MSTYLLLAIPLQTSSPAEAAANVLENVLHSFVAESDPQQQITYEDFDQIGKLDLEELDIKWQMAKALCFESMRFAQKAGRKFKLITKMLSRFMKKEGTGANNVHRDDAVIPTSDVADECLVLMDVVAKKGVFSVTSSDATDLKLKLHLRGLSPQGPIKHWMNSQERMEDLNRSTVCPPYLYHKAIKEKLTDIVKIKGGLMHFGGGRELKNFNLFSVVTNSVITKNTVSFYYRQRVAMNFPRFFQLPDFKSVVLRSSKETQLYFFNLTDIHSKEKSRCWVGKSILRCGVPQNGIEGCAHVNFLKKHDKLAKHRLSQWASLPNSSQIEHTVLPQQGKQHKGLLTRPVTSIITIFEPLQLHHMDLFGPTSIRSIDHKHYSLVVTDDFSRYFKILTLMQWRVNSTMQRNMLAFKDKQMKSKFCCKGVTLKTADTVPCCSGFLLLAFLRSINQAAWWFAGSFSLSYVSSILVLPSLLWLNLLMLKIQHFPPGPLSLVQSTFASKYWLQLGTLSLTAIANCDPAIRLPLALPMAERSRNRPWRDLEEMVRRNQARNPNHFCVITTSADLRARLQGSSPCI
ncbi:hypothetical protein Tco_1375899 [Tanacetum coccineum]